ncbi:MAG TPA: ABC transporter substrate-binding protein [Chromatiales bacterium]|nr:ABC transporter substrate-binding protein [Thiotrichales bacterium]HIP68266.1 ABC transporter substrate-binding protein [Chromatiales bacterium]
MHPRHILILSTFFLTLLSTNAQAENYPPAPSGPYTGSASTQQKSVTRTPLDVLKDGIAQLQDFISSGEIYDQDKFDAFVNNQVKPFFDFDEMSRLVAGRHYQGLSPQKRQQFKARLEEMFLLAFMKQVSLHAGPQPRVDFLRPRFRGPDEVEALARVLFPNGSAKRLVFRFHKGKKGWKVYDVAANGTSAVLYYRRHFMNQVRRYGPQALVE